MFRCVRTREVVVIRVIVVDDSAVVREVMQKILR
jgi:CheY-like chemotaxis protein